MCHSIHTRVCPVTDPPNKKEARRNTQGQPLLCPILLLGLLPPPPIGLANVLPGYIPLFFLGHVVFFRSLDLLLLGISQVFQVFIRHELVVHPTLEVLLGQVSALVMHILGIL